MYKFYQLLFLTLILITSLLADAEDKLSLAVIDIDTKAYPSIEAQSLNDIFRTELFKTNLFDLVERGEVLKVLMEQQKINLIVAENDLVTIGEALSVEKIMTARFFELEGILVLNCKIVDVSSQKIEYTENIYAKKGGLIFPVKELVEKVAAFYESRKMSSVVETSREGRLLLWQTMGATEGQASTIEINGGKLSQFYTIRQYDIRFTPKEYAALLESQTNFDYLLNFLKQGIRFEEFKESMVLGIFTTESYMREFAPYGLSYKEYLHAYKNEIYSAKEYKRFIKTNTPGRLSLGVGGIVDKFPVESANFKTFIVHSSYEHYFTPNYRDKFKWSPEVGMNFMDGFLPIPYISCNAYLGKFPLYGKLSVGAYYEPFLGGHAAIFTNLGVELNQTYEVRFMIIPIGNQSAVSYTADENGEYQDYGDPGYKEIIYPYMGIFFDYKIPLVF